MAAHDSTYPFILHLMLNSSYDSKIIPCIFNPLTNSKLNPTVEMKSRICCVSLFDLGVHICHPYVMAESPIIITLCNIPSFSPIIDTRI